MPDSNDINARLAKLLVQALGVEGDEIRPSATLQGDLGAESIDFLDITFRLERGAIPKCGHVALVLDCCYVDICVIFSSSGSLRMRLISQFSRASGARFSETDDSP